MIAEIILKTLRKVLPDKEYIPLHEPFFDDNEINNIRHCIKTTYVSSVGKYVDQFEKMLAEFTGIKRAVAVVNGTAALHIALKLAGVKQNDEVLLPTMSFVATPNAVSYLRAIPHFVDSEEKTLGINSEKLKSYLKEIGNITSEGLFNKFSNRRIQAIIPVHTFGHPADLDALVEICDEFHLTMVEDAAESIGSYYKGRHTGTTGLLSALSFNGNKIITTGGGGAILTNNDRLADHAKHITTTAKIPHKWEFNHDQIGYNYRMPNLNAALGCAQLDKLPMFLEKKKNITQRYKDVFSEIEGVKIFENTKFCESNYWLNTILLNDDNKIYLNEILETTNSNGIMTRPVWKLLHSLPIYSECPCMDLNNAIDLEQRIINIPSSSFL